jgi:hypothetical protein
MAKKATPAESTSVTKSETTKEVAAPNPAWDAYQKRALAVTARSSRPNIKGLRLNGNTGDFSASSYDAEKKETVYEEFAKEDKKFPGVILAVRYFAKWKFKENAPFTVLSREFADFRHDPITLLKIDNINKGNKPEEKVYDNYAAFKDAFVKVDDMDGSTKSPFDLWVSLYVFVAGDLIRYRFKGASRAAWFDFTKDVPDYPLHLVEFGVSEPIEMPAKEGEDPKVYYAATFADLGGVPADHQNGVIEASSALHTWFGSFTQTEQVSTVAALGAGEDTEVVALEDIPF